MKYLSTWTKREQSYFLSRDDRKGKSPNHCDVKGLDRCHDGVVGYIWIKSRRDQKVKNHHNIRIVWES